MYKARNTIVHVMLPIVCMYAHTRPTVTLTRSEITNKSARTRRNGELPSAVTATLMKNQNH